MNFELQSKPKIPNLRHSLQKTHIVQYTIWGYILYWNEFQCRKQNRLFGTFLSNGQMTDKRNYDL